MYNKTVHFLCQSAKIVYLGLNRAHEIVACPLPLPGTITCVSGRNSSLPDAINYRVSKFSNEKCSVKH